MLPDGNYERVDKRGKAIVNSQEQFLKEAKAEAPKMNVGMNERVFVPAEPV